MTGPPVSPNDYSTILDQEQASAKPAMQQSMYVASKRPAPDRWAQVLQLAQKNNLPTDVVDRNFDQLQAHDTQTTPDYDHMSTDTPGLAKWIQDPDNATLGHKELPQLGQVDRGARMLAAPPPQTLGPIDAARQALSTGWNDLGASTGQLAAAFGLTSPQKAAQMAAEHNAQAKALRAQMPDYATEFNQVMAEKGKDVNDALRTFADAQQAWSRRDILDALKGYASGAIHTVGSTLDMIRAAAMRPRGLAYNTVESLVSTAPALLAAGGGAATGAAIGGAVGSVEPGGGTVVGGVGGGAIGGVIGLSGGTFLGMLPITVGQKINDELTKRGYDVTNAADLERAYSDPKLMSIIRGKAEREGLTVAAVNALFASVGGKFLAGAEGGSVASKALAGAADIGVQAGGQTVADVAGQVAGNKSVKGVDVGQALQSGVTALGYGFGQELIGASRRAFHHTDVTQAATEVQAHADNALRTQRDVQALQEVGQAVKDAPTTASVPDRLKSLIETATGGKDAAAVHFDPTEWDHYWQSKGASPAKAAADIIGDDGKAYYEAKVTDAPMKVPLSDYVVKVAPTEDFEGLLPFTRTKPDGMSLHEASQYLESLPATMNELATEAGKEPTEITSPAHESAAQVGKLVEEQLVAAGRPAREAAAAGQLYASTFKTMGDRVGMDPKALFDQYNLSIQQRLEPAPGDAALPSDHPGPALAQSPKGWDAAEGGGETFPPKGVIRFGTDKINIDLFKTADRSTFLHETGHFYLNMLSSLEGKSADLKADMNTVRDWLGAKEGEPITRAQHEQFARGFEAYLMEGKAPSSALAETFYRFKTWLTNLYRNVAHLNVPMNDEIRGVFDRMLASHDEIRETETREHVTPLFDNPKEIGMNDEQALSYTKAIRAAHESAENELTTKMMREVQREESAEWKAWREPIEREVTTEVRNSKVSKALTELTASFQLDRASVKEMLGPEALRQLPKGITTTENGVHPDVAAEVLGFKNGQDMLAQLAHTPPEKQLIKFLTDQRMQEQHGQRMTDDQVREQAIASVRGEQRVQVLRKELEYLASDHLAQLKGLVKTITKKIPPTDLVREQAAKIIGSKAVGDISPRSYELAAAKAAATAKDALLRGDVDAAFEAKRQELLTTEVFRAAQDARETIDASLEKFKKFFGSDEKITKTRDMDLVNAGRAILATYGLGKSDRPAASYLEQLRHYDPTAFDAMQEMVTQATTAQGDYKTLSYDDFTDLKDNVDAIWNLSRRVRQVEIDGQLMDRETIKGELADRFRELTPADKDGYDRAATKWEKTKMHLMGAKAALTRVEHWARAMDAGESNGVFRKYIWNPISEGATAYRAAREEALGKYLQITKALEGTTKGGPIESPELGYEFRGKAELLGAMLHTGNESNLSKLLRGRGWGTVDENGVLDTSRWDAFVKRMQSEGKLTKGDYDYLQGTWDLFDQLKEGAQQAHKAMYGRYFNEITAKSFETPYGEYRGGYAPAKVDPLVNTDAAIRSQKENLLGSPNSFMFPTAGKGFTKSRTEAYAEPLIMDASYVPSHIDAVLRFTHIEPRVRDIARVIMSKGMQGPMDAFDPTVRGDLLVPWLQRAAQQRVDVPATGWGGKAADTFFREMRTRTGLNILSANVVVGALQLGHFPAAALRVEPGHLLSSLWRFVRGPGDMADMIAEKSSYMATRSNAAMMEVRKSIDDLMLDPSTYEKARNFSKEHGQFLTHGIQSVLDHIVWSGAYDQAVEKGMSETEAVRESDAAVRQTQGSYEPESVSQFEASSPMVKFFSMFYSFFNNKANLLSSDVTSTMRSLGLRQGAGKLMYIYTMGFMLPSVVAGVIRQASSGKPFVDDDGLPADVLKLFFESQAEMATRAVPVLGPMVQGSIDWFKGKDPADDIGTSPAIKAVEASVKTPADVYHAIRDKEIKTKEIKDVLTALGLLSGLPVAPLAKPLGYMHDLSTGKATPSGPLDMTRGLLTGQTGGH